jgi:hypothetical protein
MTKSTSNDNETANPKKSEVYKAGAKVVANVLTELCADEPTLNKNEQFSIKALVAFAANEKGVSEDVVLAMVTTRFNARSIDRIYSRHFDATLQYLVDLNPKANIN